MAVTSGTYNFANTPSDQLIQDSFERIGLLPDEITVQKVQSAQRSANLILSQWVSRGLNLWTVTQSMLGLNPFQNAYALPTNTSDVLEATIRTSNRQLGGTAFSTAVTGGVAQNAFDGNPATACTQTAPNGYIGYDWGANRNINVQMVGVQSNALANYTLSLQYSFDNVTWTTSVSELIQSFPINQIIWFVIPVPTFARYFRILETGGATLNIQELYFNTAINDTIITRISRSEYISYPVKNQTGQPTSFWVDRQIKPVIYLWPTPILPYNNMYYTRVTMMQDIGQLTNLAQIPQRFYEAICANLAVKLAIKNQRMNMLDTLRQEAKDAFDIAAAEDTERVPLRIFSDYQGGYAGE